jgi:hypothetical protein
MIAVATTEVHLGGGRDMPPFLVSNEDRSRYLEAAPAL